MKSLVLVFTLLFSLSSWARLSDGKVSFAVSGGKILGTVQKGFHFNKEAPASFTMKGAEIAPLVKEEQQLVFALPAKEREAFELGFYVCDDKKTVCEEHKMSFVVESGKLKSATEASAKSAEKSVAPAVMKTSAKVEKNHHGFIVNDLEAAKALALKSRKNLLVDYGAPWCPACVRLETEVFGTKKFQTVAKDYVLVALNADMSANKDFGKKYGIKAIPTVLVLKPDGSELYRSLDFVPADEFAKRIQSVKKNQKSNEELEKLATAGDKGAMLGLADQARNALDYEKAVKWYVAAGTDSDRYAMSEMGLWSDKAESEKKETEYIAVLKKWSETRPKTFTAVTAANDWGSYLQKNKKELPAELKEKLTANLDFLKKLAASKSETVKWVAAWDVSAMAPAERAEVLSMWMTAADLLNNKEEFALAKDELKKEMATMKLSEKRPGEVMAVLYYFRTAEMPAEEESWLLKLLKEDSNSYVPYMKLASYYIRQKSFEKALPQAEKAVELGADMRLYNLKTLAEIHKELKHKDEAKKTIEVALADPEIKTDRYKGLLKSLEEMKKAL
ncbi:thioredoxin family protein [Bdellovibrio bacteriovorus]|uniref:thioredoxin family protein n=1 Tax=Bdellovibrio bacteriovorus TaxID=959 RepID=UPI0021D09018|nr:thioredoxin family protein [Bdellovibrio bacteriovorus]UXR63981.1 thioredoxin family protein [Bdellovibrio bacteriovorus]